MRNADQEPVRPETASAAEVARRSAVAAVHARLLEISRLSPSDRRHAATPVPGGRAGADLSPEIDR
jgi:hypothetical protein